MRSHPVLNREPLRTSPFHQVSRRIDPSLLNFVRKLWLLQGDREGEINSFFLSGVLLIDGVVQLDFLFRIKQEHFKLDGTRVRVRTLQANGMSPRRLLCTEILASVRGVNRQIRL